MQEPIWKSIQHEAIFRRRQNVVLLSVVGGLFLLGFGVSRVKAKRSEKSEVPTLFGTK
jgi:hypothetical protein